MLSNRTVTGAVDRLLLHPHGLLYKQNISLTFTTHIVAEGQQCFGILRVVRDLHHGDEGQVKVAESLSKVIRNKDSRPKTSRHFACQDNLQAKIQTDEIM